MKMTVHLVRLIEPVSLRIAWLIRRACTPTLLSPISPSSSDLGVRAATESTTTRLTAPERTSVSTISSACSPVSGCEISNSSRSTPSLRIDRVKRVFSVDKGAYPALFLFLGHAMQGQRGLARAFRPVNLDYAALGDATDAKRDVEADRPGRGRLDIGDRIVAAHLHDRALTELPFDLGQGAVERLLLVCVALVIHGEKICRCHSFASLFHTRPRAAMIAFVLALFCFRMGVKQEHFKRFVYGDSFAVKH